MAPSQHQHRRRRQQSSLVVDYTPLVAKLSRTNAVAIAGPLPKSAAFSWYYYLLLLFAVAVVAVGAVVIAAAVGKFWFFAASSSSPSVASSTAGAGSLGGTSSIGSNGNTVSSPAVVVPSYTLHTNTSWPVTSVGAFVVGQIITIITSSTPSVTLTGQIVATSASPYPTIVVYGLSVSGPNQGAAIQGWNFYPLPSSSSSTSGQQHSHFSTMLPATFAVGVELLLYFACSLWASDSGGNALVCMESCQLLSDFTSVLLVCPTPTDAVSSSSLVSSPFSTSAPLLRSSSSFPSSSSSSTTPPHASSSLSSSSAVASSSSSSSSFADYTGVVASSTITSPLTSSSSLVSSRSSSSMTSSVLSLSSSSGVSSFPPGYPSDVLQPLPSYWFIADSVNASSGQNVTYWNDTLNPTTQSFGPSTAFSCVPPTLITNAYQNHSAVRFLGGACMQTLTTSTTTTYINATLAFMLDVADLNSYFSPILTLVNGPLFLINQGTALPEVFQPPYTSASRPVLLQTPTVLVFTCVQIASSSYTFSYFINGVLSGTVTTNPGVLFTYLIMGTNNGVFFYDGDIMELLMYSYALSSAQVAALTAYLASKYAGSGAAPPAGTQAVFVRDYGASPAVPDNSKFIQAAVAYAVNYGVPDVVFDANVQYNLTAPAWDVILSPNTALNIVGNGSTLMFIDKPGNASNVFGMVDAFNINTGTSFSVTNLVFDLLYPSIEPSTYVGQLTSTSYLFSIYPGDPPAQFTTLNTISTYSSDGLVEIGGYSLNAGATLQVYNSQEYLLTTTTDLSGMAVGQIVTLYAPLLAGGGLNTHTVDTLLYENVTMFASPFAGMLVAFAGNVTMRNTSIVRKAGRLTTSVVDVCGMTDIRGDILVEHSSFGWGGDDIHNTLRDGLEVLSPAGNSASPVISSTPTSVFAWFSTTFRGRSETTPTYNYYYGRDLNGAFIEDNTAFNGLALFTALVTLTPQSSVVNGVTYVAVNFSANAWVVSSLPLDARLNYYIFERAVNSTFTFRHNNYFMGRSRALLLDNKYQTIVENCTFTNILNSPIVSIYFNDAGWNGRVSNLFVNNNSFVVTVAPFGNLNFWGLLPFLSAPTTVNGPWFAEPTSALGIVNITFINNYVSYGQSLEAPVLSMSGVSNILVANNTMSLFSGSVSGIYPVTFQACEGINVYGNVIGPSVTTSGISVDSMTTNSNISYPCSSATGGPGCVGCTGVGTSSWVCASCTSSYHLDSQQQCSSGPPASTSPAVSSSPAISSSSAVLSSSSSSAVSSSPAVSSSSSSSAVSSSPALLFLSSPPSFWYIADSVNLATGQNVTSWNDTLNPLNQTLGVPPTLCTPPTLVQQLYNNHSAVRFLGGNCMETNVAFPTYNLPNVSFVVEINSFDFSRYFNILLTFYINQFILFDSTGAFSMFPLGSSTATVPPNTPATIAITAAPVNATYFTYSYYLNGLPVGQTGSSSAFEMSQVVVGGNFGPNYYDGDVMEVMFFDYTLTPSQVINVTSYLINKYTNGSSGNVAPFVPSNNYPVSTVPSLPSFWYIADSIALSTGQNVTSWSDSQYPTNQTLAVPSTLCTPPTLVQQLYNNHSAVRFLGGDCLQTVFFPNYTLSNVSFVMAIDSFDFSRYFNILLTFYINQIVLFDSTGAFSVFTLGSSTATVPPNTLATVAITLEPVNATYFTYNYYLNGLPVGETGSSSAFLMTPVIVGTNLGPYWFDGDVMEVMFFDYTLTAPQVSNVTSYLNNKYTNSSSG